MRNPNPLRTLIFAASLLLQFSTLCFDARGAAGDVDLSFDPGSGVNGTVNAIAVQPDGKVIIGGVFTTVKGLVRTNLARLNADGSGDATFNPGIAHNLVSFLALQSDGKVLVGGTYLNGICDDSGCYELNELLVSRLNADGSQDGSFTPATGPNGTVSAVVVQPDGKVLIGGDFGIVNGAYHNHVARLNANGSLDDSFSGTGPNYGVAAVALAPDGKVVISGSFGAVNGTNRNGIARLNANGSLDGSFNPGTGVGYPYSVSSVVVQPDGKVLIGGYFTAVNGTNRNGIARLNTDGSLDSSFDPGAGANAGGLSLALQSDGKVLIGGDFTTVNGANRNGIARLDANGGLDASFNPGTGARGVVVVALHSNGQVFIGGYFNTVNGTTRGRIARLNADGSLDGSFHQGTGVGMSFPSLVVQPDGKVLMGGLFTFINGTNRYGRVRLNEDGSVDSTFVPDVFNPDLAAIFHVACPQDRVCYNYASVISLAVQPDGRVLVGGSYFHQEVDGEGFLYDEHFIYRLARFNANGSLDSSFNFTDTGSLGRVSSIAPQSDGKIIVGSEFYPFIIARLNADGSLDSSFNPGTGPTAGVTAVGLQPDGKVVIGGSFTNVHGTYSYGIVRLNANGSPDGSFNPGTGPNGSISSIVIQPDGMVLIGGSFSSVNGTNRNRIARLNADGGLDSTFNPGTGADGLIRSIALQSDGNILISGDFLTVNGALRPYVARLHGGSPPQVSFAAWATGFGLSGLETGADEDPDFDGLSNAIEYICGGNPSVASRSVHPAFMRNGGGFLYTFLRVDSSESEDVALSVEVGSDLVTWPAVFTIGQSTAASSPGVSVLENGTAPDTISVQIPHDAAKMRFARIKVTITQ